MDDRGESFVAVRRISQGFDRGNNSTCHSGVSNGGILSFTQLLAGASSQPFEAAISGSQKTHTMPKDCHFQEPSQDCDSAGVTVGDALSLYNDDSDNDSEPIKRPKVVPEESRLLEKKKKAKSAIGSRKINFTGSITGVMVPTDLPYSPTKLTWKGEAAVTLNQLEVERGKKISKLAAKKGKSKAN